MLALAGLAVAIKFTDLTIVDIFASILVFVPTGWGILSVSLFTLVSSVSCLSSCLHVVTCSQLILPFVATIEFQIAIAWKPLMKKLGLWKSIRSIALLYDAGMGMVIFIPIAFFSWFPFVSTFQTRLMFNQAFSRGLEISVLLAGNNPNTGI